MTIDEVVAIRTILMNITKKDKVFNRNTAEPICIRLDNDVMLNGRNMFLLWNDDKGILTYYTSNEKTGTAGVMYGAGEIVYPAIVSFTTYDNIQEMWIPLRFDSFGQSLAVLKADGGFKGVGDFNKEIPIDDDIATKMKQKLFDRVDPSKEDKGDYSREKRKLFGDEDFLPKDGN